MNGAFHITHACQLGNAGFLEGDVSMTKSFEARLIELSSEEKLKAAKQLLKGGALVCAWRDDHGKINATFQSHSLYIHTTVSTGEQSTAQCSRCAEIPDKICEHALAAIMHCSRFQQLPAVIDDGIPNYAGLKYETIDSLASRRSDGSSAHLLLEAISAFPHVPSKWENAVLNVRLRNADREYLGNINNLRQLFFEKTLNISLELSDFPLQDQQIIRYLAINGEPDGSNILLNSEKTAEFFHCLVGFDRFCRNGRRLFVHGDQCEAVVISDGPANPCRISPGIRVNGTILPIRHAKVITGSSGCWIGCQGEYYFVPATVDVAWLRNFFRTGVQETADTKLKSILESNQFPLPVVHSAAMEIRESPCRILLDGLVDANMQFHMRVNYLYDNHVFSADSGRLAHSDHEFVRRNEDLELSTEKELEMFGFRRSGQLFSLKDPEVAGEFLDRVLPMWLASRSNICLGSSLARIIAGGKGLTAVTLSCRINAVGDDHYILAYRLEADGESLSFQRVADAARAGRKYFSTPSGAQARITEPLLDFMRGSGNVVRLVSEEEHTFVLPFHSVQYFMHLTKNLPSARPHDLSATPVLSPEKGQMPAHSFNGSLRPYQQDGVDWLLGMTNAGFNVILADEMGLGKTVQTLAFLAAVKTAEHNPALVICPSSLVHNWERECLRFIPDFRIAALSGCEREKILKTPSAYDLIVASYAIARRDAAQLSKLRFSYLILDEAQHIKNPDTANARDCKAIVAKHRIVLTGTPLENSIGDLWSIFDFLQPDMLGTAHAFRRYYADIKNNRSLREDLAARISPFFKRRTKAEVGHDLPPKQVRMLFCVMGDSQRQLYETVRERGYRQLADLTRGKSNANAAIFTTLLRLRQICCHPGLLPDNDASRQVPSAKFELLQELIHEHIDSGHKLLLFSQFTSLLGKIAEWLDGESICYEYMDGTTRNRQERVEHFNTDPSLPLFLLSLKAGGTGLNLTSADTVVICDPWWNPAVEQQAADRTHRIGQTRPVSSLKLLVKDTIEEKILKLQEQKQEIFTNIVDNPNAIANKLSIDELRFLLK